MISKPNEICLICLGRRQSLWLPWILHSYQKAGQGVSLREKEERAEERMRCWREGGGGGGGGREKRRSAKLRLPLWTALGFGPRIIITVPYLSLSSSLLIYSGWSVSLSRISHWALHSNKDRSLSRNSRRTRQESRAPPRKRERKRRESWLDVTERRKHERMKPVWNGWISLCGDTGKYIEKKRKRERN